MQRRASQQRALGYGPSKPAILCYGLISRWMQRASIFQSQRRPRKAIYKSNLKTYDIRKSVWYLKYQKKIWVKKMISCHDQARNTKTCLCVCTISMMKRKKIYTDQTCHFPTKSSRGNQYIIVMCEMDSDIILFKANTAKINFGGCV